MGLAVELLLRGPGAEMVLDCSCSMAIKRKHLISVPVHMVLLPPQPWCACCSPTLRLPKYSQRDFVFYPLTKFYFPHRLHFYGKMTLSILGIFHLKEIVGEEEGKAIRTSGMLGFHSEELWETEYQRKWAEIAGGSRTPKCEVCKNLSYCSRPGPSHVTGRHSFTRKRARHFPECWKCHEQDTKITMDTTGMESKSAQEYEAKMSKEGQKWPGRRRDDRNRSHLTTWDSKCWKAARKTKGHIPNPRSKGRDSGKKRTNSLSGQGDMMVLGRTIFLWGRRRLRIQGFINRLTLSVKWHKQKASEARGKEKIRSETWCTETQGQQS